MIIYLVTEVSNWETEEVLKAFRTNDAAVEFFTSKTSELTEWQNANGFYYFIGEVELV